MNCSSRDARLGRYHLGTALLGATLAASLVLSAPRAAADDEAARGRSWLLANIGADGSWRSARDPSGIGSTARALAALGPQAPRQARSWLSNRSTRTVAEAASASLVLGAETPSCLVAPLTSQKIRFGRWGSLAGSGPAPYHTALALLTLMRTGAGASSEVLSARDYLLSSQYPDGSWAAGERGQEAAVAAATTLEAVLASGASPSAPEVARARDWLVAHQNGDGGWGLGGSCPAVTAQVLLALRSVGGWSQTVEERAAGYLEGTQAPDGSWDEDPWITALAVSALSSAGMADLSFALGGVAASPDPVPGDRWQVSLTVANHGTVTAGVVSVRLRLTDAEGGEVFREEKTADGLGPGGLTTVSFAVDTAALAGVYRWSVDLDSADLVREGDEDNNRAEGTVDVGGTRTLSLVSGSLRFYTADGLLELAPSSLSVGASVLLRAQIRAEGTRGTGPVEVWFYWRDPADGVLVGSAVAPALLPGGVADVSVPWTISLPPGQGSLVAVLDPRGLVAQTGQGVRQADVPVDVASADTTPPEPPAGLTASLVTRDHVDVTWQPSSSPDVIGYRLYRDGIPAYSVDLAPTSVPSASDSYNLRDYLPEEVRSYAAFDTPNLIDGDPRTSWWSIQSPYEEWEPDPCYVEFDLGAPKGLRAVIVQWFDFDYAAADFRIQTWNGRAWADAAVVRDNLFDRSVIVLPSATVTDSVRILIDRGLNRQFVAIRDVSLVEAGPGRVVQGTSLVDTALPGLPATYTVTAVDAAGNESTSSSPFVLEDLEPPTVSIVSPVPDQRVGPEVPIRGTASDEFLQGYALEWVKGDYTAAEPPEWHRADQRAEPVADGSLFAWHPPKGIEGLCTVRVVAADGGGVANTREHRVRVWVDTVAPAPPQGLVSSRADDRVRLTWRSNTESDLAGYRVTVNGEVTGLKDVAREGHASASATYSDSFATYAPGNAVDGDPRSYWHPPEGSYPCWWSLEWDTPMALRRVVLTWGAMISRRFQVETRDARGVWAPRWSTDENESGEVTVELTTAEPVTAFRVTMLEGVILGWEGESSPLDPKLIKPPAPYPALAGVVLLAEEPLLPRPEFETVLSEAREYGLTVEAVDDVGNRSAPSQAAVVDLRGPRVAILTPKSEESIGRAVVVSGLVSDRYLKDYVLEVGSIAAAGEEPNTWEEIRRSMTPISWGEIMTVWYPTLRKGLHALRLTAQDQFGQTSVARTEFTLDAMPPEAPANLVVSENPEGVSLHWDPSVEEADGSGPASDLAGYRVYRDSVPLTVTDVGFLGRVTAPTLYPDFQGLPSWMADGLDGSGWRPVPFSERAEILVDLPQPFLVSRIGIDWGDQDWEWGRDFSVEAWDRGPGAWVTVADVSDLIAPRWEGPFSPMATDRLRITLKRGPTVYSLGAISEIHVYRETEGSLLTSNTYVDPMAEGSEAAYRVTAVDEFGNESPKSNRVRIDWEPPRVALTAPAPGPFRHPAGTVIAVTGTVDEPLLREYWVEVGAGEDPLFWETLYHLSGDLAPIPNPTVLAFWRLPEGEEGDFTFRLSALDEGGRRSEARVTVQVDTLPPAAPAGLSAAVEEGGVRLNWDAVADSALVCYHVYRNGNRLDSHDIAGLAEVDASSSVSHWYLPEKAVDGHLYSSWLSMAHQVPAWLGLAFDGRFPVTGVSVDFDPWYPAVDFSSQGWDPQTASWVDLAEVSDLSQNPYQITFPEPVRLERLRIRMTRMTNGQEYLGIREINVFRAPGAETPVEPHFLDDAVSRLEYTYRVTAVDAFGNESIPSNEVPIDAIPPRVTLVEPGEGQRLGAHVELTGTVEEWRLLDYRLEVGKGERPASYEVVGVWERPIEDSVVSVWDPPAGENGPWRMRLVARDLSGQETSVERGVWVDTTPPPTPIGLFGQVAGAEAVQLRWEPVAASDLAGYRVYRNGVLLNEPLVSPWGTATAAYDPISAKNALDGHLGSYWETVIAPVSWEEDWPSEVLIDRVEIFWKSDKFFGFCGPPIDYEFQVKTAEGWQTVQYVWNNGFTHRIHSIPVPASGSGFRILLTKLSRVPACLQEVALRDGSRNQLIGEGSYLDGGLTEVGGSYWVSAVDELANESEASAPVSVDERPPAVALTSPGSGAEVGGPVTVTGTAQDVNLAFWRLEAGRGAEPSVWEEIAFGAKSVHGAKLGDWAPPGDTDSVFTLRLTARDRAGLSSVALVTVQVLTRPPAPPEQLTAAISETGEIVLSWDTPGIGEVAGYNIYRNEEKLNRADLAPMAIASASSVFNSDMKWAPANVIDADPDTQWVPEPFLVPSWLALDFRQRVRVQGVAVAWFEEIAGRSFIGVDYQIQVRQAGNWTSVIFVENNRDQRRVDSFAQPIETDGIRVLITRGSDTLFPGIIRGIQVFSAEAWDPVTVTRFTDSGLAPIEGVYSVKAVDAFGHESPAASLLFDREAPRVSMVSPEEGERVPAGFIVRGRVEDGTLAGIEIACRLGENAAWQTAALLSSPLSKMEIARFHLPPETRYEGVGALRVRAWDAAGNLTERLVSVVFDTTPPEAPTAVSVEGGGACGAHLSWLPSPSPDVIGYFVKRAGQVLNPDNFAEAAVASASDVYLGAEAHQPWAAVDGLPDWFSAPRVGPESQEASSDTYWLSDLHRGPKILEVALPDPIPLNRIGILFEVSKLPLYLCPPRDFTLEAMVEGNWQIISNVANYSCPPVGPAPFWVELPEPVLSNRIRLTATRGNTYPDFMIGVHEMALRGPGIVSGAEYWDRALGAEETSYEILAQDEVGNVSVPSQRAVLDAAPPRVAITAPSDGSHTGRTLSVEATVQDPNLESWHLWWGQGEDSTQWSLLAQGSGPFRPFCWTANQIEGPVTLHLKARDLAGHEAEDQVTVWVDGKPPVPPVRPTATAQTHGVALTWPTSVAPDAVGYLLYRDGRPLTAENVAGLGKAWASSFFVWWERYEPSRAIDGARSTWSCWENDPHAPGPVEWGLDFDEPVLVRGVAMEFQEPGVWSTPEAVLIEGWTGSAWKYLSSIEDNWDALREVSFDPVSMSRIRLRFPQVGETPVSVRLLEVSVRPAGPWGPVSAPSFVDSWLADPLHTEHEWSVAAVDASGNVSLASESIILDALAPRLSILSPGDSAVVGSRVEIRGRVEDRFLESWTMAAELPGGGSVEIASGTQSIADGPLGTWVPPSGLTGVVAIRLSAADTSGNHAEVSSSVTVDAMPPSAPSPPVVRLGEDGLWVTWLPPPEQDVVGYLVYRNGELLQVPDLARLGPVDSQGVKFPENAVDGYEQSDAWADGSSEAPWWSVKFRTPHALAAVEATWPKDPRCPLDPLACQRLELQVLREGEWLTVARVEGEDRLHAQYPLAPAVAGDGFRLVCNQQYTWRVAELKLVPADTVPVSGTSYRDVALEQWPRQEAVYEVAAVDSAGNVGPRSEGTPFDAAAPRLVLQAPEPGAQVGRTIRVEGSIQDATLAWWKVEASFGGGEWLEAASGTAPVTGGPIASWTAPSGVEGSAMLRLTAEDRAGNRAVEGLALVIDAQPPAPPAGVRAEGSQAGVRVSWDPNEEADLAGYRIYRNGVPLLGDITPWATLTDLRGGLLSAATDPNPTTSACVSAGPPYGFEISFDRSVALGPVNLLFGDAYPSEFFWSHANLALEVWSGSEWNWVGGVWQSTQPSVSIPVSFPAEGRRFRVVSWDNLTAFWPGQCIDLASVSISSRESILKEASFLIEGSTSVVDVFTVTAVDALGNESDPALIDWVPPIASISMPVPNATVRDSFVLIYGSAEDPNPPSWKLEAVPGTTGGEPLLLGEGSGAVRDALLAVWDVRFVSGFWRLVLEATDTNGNRSVRDVPLQIVGPPTVRITSPDAGLTGNRSPLLTFQGGTADVTVKVDGAPVPVTSGQTLPPLADGRHVIRVEVRGSEGGSVFDEVDVRVDATPPIVTIASPVPGVTADTTPVLACSTDGGVLRVLVDGEEVAAMSGQDLGPLPEGAHSVRAEATDQAGNVGYAQVAFEVRAEAPTVTVTSPRPGPTQDRTPLLEYAAGEGRVTVRVDGRVVSRVSGQSLDALSEGAHAVTVEVSGSDGSSKFASVCFQVDATPPAVSIQAPSGLVETDSPELAYAVSDGDVTVRVDGAPALLGLGQQLGPLTVGSHSVRVEARDVAGNLGFDEEHFEVRASECGHSLIVCPGEKIQDSIEVAGPGDVVLVRPGVYVEHLDFLGKAITVTGTDPDDPSVVAATVVDGGNDGRVVTFNQGEGRDTTLVGVTVRNGTASSPGGGGIYIGSRCSPIVSRCVIRDNAAGPNAQGHVGAGGGVYAEASSSATLERCVIRNNTAAGGGGVYIGDYASMIIRKSMVKDNAADWGGGIALCRSTLQLFDSDILGNSSKTSGGGIGSLWGTPEIRNSVVAGNTARTEGGGFSFQGMTSLIVNTTVADNSAPRGAGLSLDQYNFPTVRNCIFWDASSEEIYTPHPWQSITYSDIRGGYPGEGNISFEPVFANAAAGDYRLLPGSRCLDAGADDDAPAEDRDGRPRPQDDDGDGVVRFDLGAFEGHAPMPGQNHPPAPSAEPIRTWRGTAGNTTVEPGDPDRSDNRHRFAIVRAPNHGIAVIDGDGLVRYSPEAGYVGPDTLIAGVLDAAGASGIVAIDVRVGELFRVSEGQRIQAAIASASDGDAVIVEPGIYVENLDFLGKAITVRSTDPEDPAVVAATIVDGGPAGSVVRFAHGESSDTTIAGLTITNGVGSDGGGLYLNGTSPSVVNCVISKNHAVNGGGLWVFGGAPRITGCTFEENSAEVGGGIFVMNALAVIASSRFVRNSAADGGGGYFTGSTTLYLAASSFSENTASRKGGGASLRSSLADAPRAWISDCAFLGNTAAEGGGVFEEGTLLDVGSCRFRENSATDSGGGITCSSSCRVHDSEITENSTAKYGGGIYGAPEITNCVIADNHALSGGGVWSRAAKIRNSTIRGNFAQYAGGGLYAEGAQIVNSVLSKNSTTGNGGAIYATGTGVVVGCLNCTIADNSAGGLGGAYRGYRYGGFTNSILWGNLPGEISSERTPPTVAYSDVQGGYPGEGNIDGAPMFLEPEVGDYRLQVGSPCIDGGTGLWQDQPAPDLDREGWVRPQDGDRNGIAGFDIGAHEFPGKEDFTPPAVRTDLLAGSYPEPVVVSLSAGDESDARPRIFYTLDGSAPTEESTLYSEPLTIPNPTTIRYIAVDQMGNSSAVQEATFAIQDTDGDGLSDWMEDADHDGVERDFGETDPADADTDDDGLTDGREDANRNGIVDALETDPRAADSDHDGIPDGTEAGLAESQTTDTDSVAFHPDADPASRTDPAEADTDHDGLADGVEDENRNGRLDQGETDPNRRDTDGDWVGDGDEVALGFDPLDPLASPKATTRVSLNMDRTDADGASSDPAIGGGGRFVAFASSATDLVPDDRNGQRDLFLLDRSGGSLELLSVSTMGEQGDGYSSSPSTSADGRFVAFASSATNLVPGDSNGRRDIFLRDRIAKTTVRVSVSSSNVQTDGDSGNPRLSADGRFLAFESSASNLVSGDWDGGKPDVFVRDLQTGTTEIASSLYDYSAAASQPSISPDGRYVAFLNWPTGGWPSIHLFDVVAKTRNIAASCGFRSGIPADCSSPSLSTGARYIAYSSDAENLIPGDNNWAHDVFVYDRVTGYTDWVSRSTDGALGNGSSFSPSISADGRYVSFSSFANNLDGPGGSGTFGSGTFGRNVYLRDRWLGRTERISVTRDGSLETGSSDPAVVSSQERVAVAFASDVGSLVSNDGNGVSDVFVRDLGAPIGSASALSDPDGDGLPTLAEDLNGNGILDPGETDPFQRDTDADRIPDGTELGLVAPRSPETASPLFVPDRDPTSRTDPMNPDSDGDGLSDGQEDRNGNGAVDPGETDPKRSDTDADGFSDGEERAFSSDPTDPASIPDRDPPRVVIASPLQGYTNDSTPLLAYTVSDGSVVVEVDASTVPKTSGDELDGLADGPHTVRVEATDTAGNIGSAEVSFTVDATPPARPFLAPIPSPTREPFADVSGTCEAGEGYAVRLFRNGQFTAAGAPDHAGQVSFPSVPLEEGENFFTFTVTDQIGNTSEPSAPVVVDSDRTAPAWGGAVGLRYAAPGDGGAWLYWDGAADRNAVRWNVYYSAGLPLDFGTAAKLANVTPVPGGFYGWKLRIPGLENGVAYRFAVRAEDGVSPSNEDTNTAEAEATPHPGTKFARHAFGVPANALSVADLDRDGRDEILYATDGGLVIWGRDAQGAWADVTASWGSFAPEPLRAVVAADLDNDGNLDAILAGESLRILRNDGSGHLANVTASAGVSGPAGPIVLAVLLADGDRYLDLVAGGASGDLTTYRNRGDGTFEDVTAASGLSGFGALGSLASSDLDGDGDADLLVAGEVEVRLFLNDGEGHFSEAAALPPVASGVFGAALADVDGDGDLDVFLGNRIGRNHLFRNDQAAGFADAASDLVGPTGQEASRNGLLADFDDDGDRDLFVSLEGANLFLENQGSGSFVETGDEAGVRQGAGTSAACLDVDDDGDLDVVTSGGVFFENRRDDAGSLSVRLKGTITNSGAIGARVWVYEAGHLQDTAHLRGFAEIPGAAGSASQSSAVAHFGADPALRYDLRVRYPSGITIEVLGAAPGPQVLDVVEDNTPPVTGHDYAYDRVWVSDAALVTFTATDDISGVAATRYRLDGVESPYQGLLSIASEGTHTLEFWSVDTAENSEAPRGLGVWIDRTAPVTAHDCTVDDTWVGHDVTVTLSASDSIPGIESSGVAHTYYRLGAGQPVEDVLSVSFMAEGVHSLVFWSVDRAGNEEAVRPALTVRIDKTPPATILAVGSPKQDGTRPCVAPATPFVLEASDAGSGVASTEYQADGGAWTPYKGSFKLAGEGGHTLAYRSTDRVGNREPVHTLEVELDGTAPVTTAVVGSPKCDQGGTLFVRRDTPVTFTAADAGSAVAVIEYRVGDGGAWKSYGSPVTLAAEGVFADGPVTIQVRSRDRVGNTEASHPLAVVVDETPPVTIVTVGNPQHEDGVLSITSATALTLAASDAGSGVGRREYRIDGGGWTQYAVPITVAGNDGTHSVEYRSADGLGNQEQSRVLTAVLDNTAPDIVITSPPAGTVYDSTPTLTYTFSDGTVIVRVDGTTVPKVAGDVLDRLEDGPHSVRVEATDALGNRSFREVAFNVLWTPAQVRYTELISTSTSGAVGDDDSHQPSISADGWFVAFASRARNLAPQDTDDGEDVFVRSWVTGATELASVSRTSTSGSNRSRSPSLSGDGRFVAFVSQATNLVSGIYTSDDQIYVRDRVNKTTELVTRNASGSPGNDPSSSPSVSADGRYVAFASGARNLVSGVSTYDEQIYVRDRMSGNTELVSRSASGGPGDDPSSSPSLSADGRYVAFVSEARNLVSGVSPYHKQIYVRDRVNGTTELVSRSVSGFGGNDPSSSPSISADGRYVTFVSQAGNLVSGVSMSHHQVYVRDRVGGTTRLVSRSLGGSAGDEDSDEAAISADGRHVAFVSRARNLVPGVSSGDAHAYVYDQATGALRMLERLDRSDWGGGYGGGSGWGDYGYGGGSTTNPSRRLTLSADGRFVAFGSEVSLTSVDRNGDLDVFLRIREEDPTLYDDQDGDGVPDRADDCPETSPGQPADGHGCSAAQLDDDGDWVTNDRDQCPRTPASQPVDARGCSASQR